jgi:hypothetical protein
VIRRSRDQETTALIEEGQELLRQLDTVPDTSNGCPCNHRGRNIDHKKPFLFATQLADSRRLVVEKDWDRIDVLMPSKRNTWTEIMDYKTIRTRLLSTAKVAYNKRVPSDSLTARRQPARSQSGLTNKTREIRILQTGTKS